ncbi:hypothetical protein Tco_1500397 [Tanacetum coccineum]
MKVSLVSFGRISPNSFLSSILLLVVIIVTVLIVTVILVVVVIVIVGVVIVVVFIGIVFVVVGGVSSIFKPSFVIIGWAYAFHQDKASSVRVPVANVTLSSLAHLLRENTDSQLMLPELQKYHQQSVDVTKILEFKASRDRHGDNKIRDSIRGVVRKLNGKRIIVILDKDATGYRTPNWYYETTGYNGIITKAENDWWFSLEFLYLAQKTFDDESEYNYGGYPEMNVLTINLISDEDPTEEDGDIGVSVSLGDEIFSEGKKSQESNTGDSDNTGDGGKMAGKAIVSRDI